MCFRRLTVLLCYTFVVFRKITALIALSIALVAPTVSARTFGDGTGALRPTATNQDTNPDSNPDSDNNESGARRLTARKVSTLTSETRSMRDSVRRKSGVSEAQLRDLIDDETAYIDANDQIFFVDVAADASIEPAPAPAPPSAPTDASGIDEPPASPKTEVAGSDSALTQQEAFSLHSRPGSTKTLYIDFDGATVTNTFWNQSAGLGSKTVPAYDTDGNPASFSAAELTLIGDIWSAVAEDYAPFDVDVTTAVPSQSQISRTSASDTTFGVSIVVTGDNWICPSSCAGVAYLNAFNSYTNTQVNADQLKPGWTFTSSYFAAVPAIVAGIVSHEAGHTFGLAHDGTTSVSYYAGHGIWQPIMGSGSYYSRPVSHWSRGEYTGANNVENDLAIIGQSSPTVPDDYPRIQTVDNTQVSTLLSGTIERSSDIDTFQIEVGPTGRLSATLSSNPVSPNLDAILRVENLDNAIVGESNPAGVVSSQSLNLRVAPGTYFVSVLPTGYHSPLNTGYSSYGSLGRYSLRLSLLGTPAPPTNVTTTLGNLSATVSWQPPADNGGAIDDYPIRMCWRDNVAAAWTCSGFLYPSSPTMTYGGLVAGRLYTFLVAARNAVGTSVEARSADITALRTPGTPELFPLTQATDGFTIRWSSTLLPGATTTGFERSVVDVVSGAESRRVVGAATTTDTYDQAVKGRVYAVKVRALSGPLASEWSNEIVTSFGRSDVPSAPTDSSPARSNPVPAAPGAPSDGTVVR